MTGVVIDKMPLAITIEQALFRRGATHVNDQIFRVLVVGVEVTERPLHFGLEVDGVEINRAEAPLSRNEQMVAIAMEGRGQPITLWIVSHESGGAGVSGDNLIADNQCVTDARRG